MPFNRDVILSHRPSNVDLHPRRGKCYNKIIFLDFLFFQDATSAQEMKHVVLGPRVDQGHVLAFPVPADRWFTRLVDTPATEEISVDVDFTLFSCSLAPGFHIADFKARKLRNVLNRM